MAKMKKMVGIIKELVTEIEEIEEKVFDILKTTKTINPYTRKFIIKKIFLLEF